VRNVVALLGKAERPRPARREAAYFLDSEVSAILQATPDTMLEGVFLRLALATGCRIGELSALEWSDVHLLDGEIRVRRSVTDRNVGTPKSHQARSVDFPAETVDLLGRWAGVIGDEGLVFPSPHAPYVSQKMISNALTRAMKNAGVDEADANGVKRTPHSLRHSHAKRCLELGLPMAWLSRRLGHGSVVITDTIYGHIESAARKEIAKGLDGAFLR
jgi:integrase